MAKRKPSRRISGRPSQHPWQVADCLGGRLRAGRGLSGPYPREVVLHLCLCDLGAIESKVNDGETRIYRAGESWSELPGAIHSISRNASKTERAKLLAIFVLDTNEKVLTTPVS